MSDTGADTPSSPPSGSRADKAVQITEPPEYEPMVTAAIQKLKGRSGSSLPAILQFVMDNYQVGRDATEVSADLQEYIDAAVQAGTLQLCRGTGDVTRFKLAETTGASTKSKLAETTGASTKSKLAAKLAVKKPEAKQAASPYKPAARKMKKTKVPKATRKSPASPARNTPKSPPGSPVNAKQ